MTKPRPSKTARLLALFLFCCAATLPSARAAEWIISTESGTTWFPRGTTGTQVTQGGNTAAGSNIIKDGDIIKLFVNPDTTIGGPGGDSNTAALNNPLINFQNNTTMGAAPPSFTIMSGDGNWYTITNNKVTSVPGGAVISTFNGNETITLVNVILANNSGTNNGSAITMVAASATSTPFAEDPTAVTTITGTAIFRNNGGGNPAGTAVAAPLGGAIHNAGWGSLTISGSMVFDSNLANRGGAVNTANTAQNLSILGDVLFINNSANVSGAIGFTQTVTGTLTLGGNIAFVDNIARRGNNSDGVPAGGGAIGMYAGQSGIPVPFSTDSVAQTMLTMSGSVLFDGNTAWGSGGAIWLGARDTYIGGNTQFVNNQAGALGGAIYQYNGLAGNQAAAGVTITLDATAGDILFQNNIENTGTDGSFSQPGDHNAISLYSGTYNNSGTTTVTFNTGAAGRTIWFYDPINVSDTTVYDDSIKTFVNAEVTGNGAVVFDTYQTTITDTTTVKSGVLAVTNGATYGIGTDRGNIQVQPLGAIGGNGTVQAATINIADGAGLGVLDGGVFTLRAGAGGLTIGNALRLYGNGTIDTGVTSLNASLVSVGNNIPTTYGQPLAATPSTLNFIPGTTLTIVDGGTLAFHLFDGGENGVSDLLTVDNLVLSGTAFLKFTGGNTGSYEIINAGNDLSPYASSFTSLMSGVTVRVDGSQLWIDLLIQNSIIHWTGADTGLWIHSSVSDYNWGNDGGVNTFMNGDNVTFDDSATGTKLVAIAPEGVAVAEMTVNNSAGNDYTFIGGAIATSATDLSSLTVTGKLIKSGDGLLNFSNAANDFTGGIEISGGAITFDDPAQLGDGANDIHFTGNAALLPAADNFTLANNLAIDAGMTATIDTGAGDFTYAGLLAGTGTLAKIGAGVMHLTTDNSAATGHTLVSQGILSIEAGADSAAASAITDTADGKLGGTIDIAVGATLAGNGAATGIVNAGAGATIAPGAANPDAPASLTINNLYLDNATLRFNLFTNNASDQINVTGALTGALDTTVIDIGLFQSGTFDLGSIVGALAGAGAQVTIGGNIQAAGARQTAVVSDASGSLLLESTADMSRILHWTGAGVLNNIWNPSDTNWTDRTPDPVTGEPVTLFANGDRVYFDDSAAAAPHDITVGGAGVQVSDMIVDGASNYSFAGAGITANADTIIDGDALHAGDGAGKLTKLGGGTLAFNNAANNFLGGIDLNEGVITFTDGSQLGDGGSGAGILFTGAAELATDVTGLTLDTNITVAADVTGTINAGANTLTLSGALAATGGSGTLAKIGSGRLVLAGVSDAPDAANLAIALDEGTLLLRDATYNGTIDTVADTILSSTGTSALRRANIAENSTLQLLDGTLNATGRLAFADNSTLTGAGAITGNVRLNGAVNASLDAGITLTVSGSVTGAGGFLKTGQGTLQLDTAAAFGNTGVTQLNEGTLRITGVSGAIGSTLFVPSATLPLSYDDDGTPYYDVPDSTFEVSGTTVFIPGSTYAATSGTLGSGMLSGTSVVIGGGPSLVIPSCTITIGGSDVVFDSVAYSLSGNNVFVLPDRTRTVFPSDSETLPYVVIGSATATYDTFNVAATVAQNMLLNGGTLALTGSTPLSEATANDWRGLRLIQGDNAASSVVVGANDIIHVGSGTIRYSMQGGLIVAVGSGSDSLTVLSGTANTFTGVARVDSGTLQITDMTQIGMNPTMTGAANKLSLNGGAVEFSGSGFTTTRALEVRAANNIINVDDGLNVAWGALNRSNATDTMEITKVGSGTFTLTGALQSNGPTSLTVAEGRWIARSGNGGPGTGAINVYDGAVFELGVTTAFTATAGYAAGQVYATVAAGSFPSGFTGSGTLEVTSGRYTFTSPNIDIEHINITGPTTAVNAAGQNAVSNFSPNGTINVDQGMLVLGAVSQNVGNVNLGNGATLAFLLAGVSVASSTLVADTTYPARWENNTLISATTLPAGTVVPAHWEPVARGFNTATLASLTTSGTGVPKLWFNANLALGRADHLTVLTPVSGAYGIGVANSGDLPSQYTAAVDLLQMPAGSDATFAPITPTIDLGLYKYAISSTTSPAGAVSVIVTGTGAMSNSASLINSMAAMQPMSFFSEMDSVAQRMGELHFETAIREADGGFSAWARGYGERVNYKPIVAGRGFNETALNGEAGLDYKFGGSDNALYIGAFMGYGQAQRNYSIEGDGTIESVFGGLYETVRTKSGFYVDGMIKLNNFTNSFHAISPTGESAAASYHNWAFGGSLELGQYIELPYDWFIVPQIQGSLTVVTDTIYQTDDGGMTIQVRPATITRARAGLQVGRTYETAKHGTINVYLKAYAGGQWTANGQLYVATVSGQNTRYAPAIKGYNFEGGIGLSWMFTKATQVYLDYGTTDAEYYIKPWSFSFGLRHLW